MLGKIGKKIFDEVIYPNLGEVRKEVIVPPRNGVDVGVVDLGDGRVLVTKTDPVFVVKEYGLRKAAWFAVHILASDLMTSGIPPQYALIDLNLPPSMEDEELKEMWEGISDSLKEINVMVIGGHTGRYEGVNYPMLGGFTMLGIGEKERLANPSKVKVGDEVVVTKGPAIEATALLVNTFPDVFKEEMSEDSFREAMDMYWKMSCWKDGLVASKVGVNAMHDATEGGLWNALVEMSESSGRGMAIEKEKVPIPRSVREVTDLVDIDPFTSISEGTMVIITSNGEEVVKLLKREGIGAEVIGKVTEDKAVRVDGNVIGRPDYDPFGSLSLR
ncbi:AIR synthase family protein [Sulfuracidifex tepidarius]|uniref:AIR synthase family protein n=1 Tax=Sulfuracidifex tepidarius TaxID=1294262 RepID=UPI000AC8585C|nr:AIR synthase family protein [Sulfuracidifex tepidarius]